LIEPISVTGLSAAVQSTDALAKLVVLDVREMWEYQTASLPNSLHIPMSQLVARIDEIPRDQPIACLCHHGMRSMQVAVFLERQGYQKLYNVEGGIDAWSRQIDSSVPVY
jgi:rhodanese-related sulfurtransferase